MVVVKDREHVSASLSPPGVRPPLAEAAAAGLLLLGLDVVVDLELGLVRLLRGSVLQLPDREERGGWGVGGGAQLIEMLSTEPLVCYHLPQLRMKTTD